MTNLLIAYDNKIVLSSTIITPLTQNVRFPASNLKIAKRQRRYRTTAITSQALTFDFGAETTINAFHLFDHNLTTAATITLYGSTDNFATSNVLLTAYTIDASPFIVYGQEYSYRYFKLIINDPTNGASYLELGKIFLGPYLTMLKNYNYGWKVRPVDLSESQRAKNGVVHFNKKPIYHEVTLPFSFVSTAQTQDVVNFVDSVGISVPFTITLDYDNDPINTTYYCVLTSIPEFSNSVTTLFDFTITADELV